MTTQAEGAKQSLWEAINANLLRPIQAFKLVYLPLLMVYFAFGALGLIDVSRDMWIKEKLTLSPSDLAGYAVWLGVPWTVKMVFGELVDCVPLFGSQRRSYILLGAAFVVCGLLTLAGAASGWLAILPANQLYLAGSMIVVIGAVIQDVVADAMSTEVVARTDAAGNARPEEEVRAELGMVQLLGRLALSAGILAVSGVLAGELGLDDTLARRCGLLHDIGKALDQEMEGGHPKIGCDVAERCGENEVVCHAIVGHHDDIRVDHIYTVLVATADAISASRPGARRETLEKYVNRLKDLEQLCCEFDGVETAYAIQAGREVRVIASTRDTTDESAAKICRDIAKAFEEQLTYPGEIKVTLIRETRVSETAR